MSPGDYVKTVIQLLSIQLVRHLGNSVEIQSLPLNEMNALTGRHLTVVPIEVNLSLIIF